MRGLVDSDRLWLLDDKGFSKGLFHPYDLGLTIKAADVVVFRDGDEAVAIDSKGREIAMSRDHAEVWSNALARGKRVFFAGDFSDVDIAVDDFHVIIGASRESKLGTININGGQRIVLANFRCKSIVIDVTDRSLFDSEFRNLWVYGDGPTIGLHTKGTANEVTTLSLINVFFENHDRCAVIERPSDILWINTVFQQCNVGMYRGSGRHVFVKPWLENVDTGFGLIGAAYVYLIEPKWVNVNTKYTLTGEYGYNPRIMVVDPENYRMNIPYYSDCANIPSLPEYDGEMLVCYDSNASNYKLKVGIGGAWKDIASFS